MVKSNPFFDEVKVNTNFPDMEREMLEYWEKKDVVKKYLQKNSSSSKIYSFLDGPITANNPMGVHHGWGRTYKDVWQRFKNMQGYRQRFQNGFDCQGLWVEVEVEKELGLRSKRDIENLVEGDSKKSIAKFVNLCKERVFKYAGVQTEQSKRLGYFMDWDNSYYTLSDDNNYMIWHFLKKCHEKGLIYKGRDSVPWCPRCGTAISQHEMLTEDYKELVHEALYVSYPIEGKKDEYLLIWTTTPWTLPANVAVAADAKRTYVLASDGKKKYYVLETKVKELGLKVEKKIKGADLIGFNYISPFDDLERVNKTLGDYKHRVIKSDSRILEISEDEGTGLVHVATGAGTEDFAMGKKEELPVIEVIDEEANYIGGLGEFSGKNAKKHPEIIIDFLSKKDSVLKQERYKHRYPACWRCKTELVWRIVDEWYIKIDPVRENMKSVSKKITWIPKFGLKRELDWLENMHDWLISKSRYWGLALPIWECKSCGHFEVIGSREELKEKAVEGWDKFEGNSPHRPWVDEVKIKCSKCGGEAERIPDVGNPWLDAGIVAYSTVSDDNKAANPNAKGAPLYLKDKKEWEKWIPADFITESFPGQFKNWFYALIAESTVLENKEPFKTVLGFGTLLGEDGRPMHKSWGNSIEFNEGADKIGVDVMRWMYLKQNPAENLLFGYKIADETRRRFHIKLWNVYNFFITYANLDEWRPGKEAGSNNVLDKWIISRLNQTIKRVTKYLEKYEANKATEVLDEFVDDLSNWYIRRSRDRVGPAAPDKKDKKAFYSTTYYVLTTLSKILAPFIPFMSDEIYRNLTKEDSVHLAGWPISKKEDVDKELTRQMVDIRRLVEGVHAQRKELKIPVRQPLASAQVTMEKADFPEELLMLAKDETNIKSFNLKKGGELKVKLDVKVTAELEEEAKTRELVRKIQGERKKLGAKLTQEVNVASPWLPKNKELTQYVKDKTLASELAKGEFKVTLK